MGTELELPGRLAAAFSRAMSLEARAAYERGYEEARRRIETPHLAEDLDALVDEFVLIRGDLNEDHTRRALRDRVLSLVTARLDGA